MIFGMVFKALGVVHAVEKLKVRPAFNETNASATLNDESADILSIVV